MAFVGFRVSPFHTVFTCALLRRAAQVSRLYWRSANFDIVRLFSRRIRVSCAITTGLISSFANFGLLLHLFDGAVVVRRSVTGLEGPNQRAGPTVSHDMSGTFTLPVFAVIP